MSPQPRNNGVRMPGTSTESPIDTLLRRNNNMRANNRERTYLRPREPAINRDRSSRDQEPHSSATESENSPGNQSAISSRREDREGKEKLLERLRSLGLAPNKYGNKLRSSSTNKKRSTMMIAREKDGVFFRPRIFECRHCEKLFFHKIVLKVHKKKHYPEFRCSECHKCFQSEVVYQRHVKDCTSSN